MPGSPREERPGEGKDESESHWVGTSPRLGTGLAMRWGGGLREGLQSPKQFLSSFCLPTDLPGEGAAVSFTWSHCRSLSQAWGCVEGSEEGYLTGCLCEPKFGGGTT